MVFLTFTALLIVVGFSYRPAKKALRKFLDQKHADIVQSLQEAEKQYDNARDFYQKVQQDYEESIRLNEIKLVDFKTDLQEVNKEKISKLHEIVERDLEMLRIFYTHNLILIFVVSGSKNVKRVVGLVICSCTTLPLPDRLIFVLLKGCFLYPISPQIQQTIERYGLISSLFAICSEHS